MWEISSPTLISTELKGKVKKICSTSDLNIAITTSGSMYAWAITNYQAFKPTKYNFKTIVYISTISCGAGFAVLLTTQGSIYSFGKSNNQGELGTGDYLPRVHPELILENVENEKIMQISCGYKHTIVKASNGRVFAWGLVIYLLN